MNVRNRLRFGLFLLAVLLSSPLLSRLREALPPPHEISPQCAWVHRLPLANLALAIPALSPFLALGGLLGRLTVPVFWPLTVAMTIVALFRGRWFCWHLCPTGWLTEMAGRPRRCRGPSLKRVPLVGRWLLWATLGGAALGYPLFLWLDPLSLLNGALNTGGIPRPGPAAGFAVGLGAIGVLCAVWPGLWCHRLCPLGALQEDLGRLGRLSRRAARSAEDHSAETSTAPCAPVPAAGPAMDRRSFLAIGGGVAAAATMRWLTPPGMRPTKEIIRPPGAAPEHSFKALCARCGNCLRTCPQKIIHAAGGETGWDGWLTPVVRFGPGYCDEHCRVCSQVCPTTAIRPLSLTEKQRVAMGVADVHRKTCIAWEYGAFCMVCHEHCPYKAIRSHVHNGTACPVVDEAICRGCGLCQTVCPGEGPAIRIRGFPSQRRLAVGISAPSALSLRGGAVPGIFAARRATTSGN